MKKIAYVFSALALAGCCSYSELKPSLDKTVVDGKCPVAAYHVANISYKLVGVVPLTSGDTWKAGPYSDSVGSINFFRDTCTLDDNLASVRHASKTVGATGICNVISRYDTAWAWSCFLVKKTVVKTSCVFVK